MLLRKLKREKLELWAVGVIHKYHNGWKVRKEYRRKFKSIAGPKIVKFLRVALVSFYIIEVWIEINNWTKDQKVLNIIFEIF